ncbi:hypothetical protein HC729_10015 [Vibrio sp. S12_S33]|nr:hypothetical protein [Vibrio sp. S12_S33]
MATIQVQCRFCNQTEHVRKHGKGVTSFQRFRCIEYKRSRSKRLVRRTIGFSKSEKMHDKAIGAFIEREFYL